MPAKKDTIQTLFARQMDKGASALFQVTPKGGLVVCLVTDTGGRLAKPREWKEVIPEDGKGTIPVSEVQQMEIVPLQHQFLDIHLTLNNGNLLMQRIGLHQGAWVHAEKWTTILDVAYATKHNLMPEDVFNDSAAQTPAPEVPEAEVAEEDGEEDDMPDPAEERKRKMAESRARRKAAMEKANAAK